MAESDIIKSMKEALRFAKGEKIGKVYIPHDIDTKRIRKKLSLSQSKFAAHYGFNLRTVQEWEQGRLVPSANQQLLLRLIDAEPETVEEYIPVVS